MHSYSPIRLSVCVLFATVGLSACGSGSDDSGGSGGTAGIGTNGGSGGGGTGGSTVTGAKAHGRFEIRYATGATTASSYAEIGGFMYDGPPAELVVWTKKKTEGACSLYTPGTPFCESCALGEVCVDTNVCRTPPSTHDVGDVTLSGLIPPSGANPLPLTAITNVTGTTYLSAETLPVPPCAEGTAIRLDAAGRGDYPAFSVQTQCIAPLVLSSPTVPLESGKATTLAWTASSVPSARVTVELDLSHHGGSKGKVLCDTADTGSLQIPGPLLESLMALGVTGYPKAVITRVLVGSTPVGAGQAELKIYSDQYPLVEIPGLVSCQNDTECPTGQTCQVPGQMCGISCTSNADCPTGQTCLNTTKICR
jgi:hypothetical protein